MKEQVFSAKEEAQSFKKGQRLIRLLVVVETQEVLGSRGDPESSWCCGSPEGIWKLQRFKWFLIAVEAQMVSFSHGGPEGFREPWRPIRFLRTVPRNSGSSVLHRSRMFRVAIKAMKVPGWRWRPRRIQGASEIQSVPYSGGGPEVPCGHGGLEASRKLLRSCLVDSG